jgi:TetR/AcrR family transcriptional regulator, tetracycline repressor protein
MAEPLSRERVVDAALAIVESDGAMALSMRALAEKLGVAVTAIYWHVGNKDAVLDALVERMCAAMGEIHTTGRTPHQRITSTARSVLGSLQAHGALAGLAHQRGSLAVVFAPARRALAEELAATGLRGARLADATNAIVQLVAAYALTEAVMSRSPEQPRGDVRLDDGPTAIDPVAVRRLQAPPDTRRAFEVGLDAMVRGFCA